jgi:hypothetical protein
MYINPIELLGLEKYSDTISIDTELIKKEKKKLFAEIELSDNNSINYYGHSITKGNCEKVIDELNNNDFKEFYFYLSGNKLLNEYLANGNENVFNNFQQDSIYKLPEFIKFISPYLAERLNKSLLISFENNNVEKIIKVLSCYNLIVIEDINTAYKSVSNYIQNNILQIDQITREIKNGDTDYVEEDIHETIELVKKLFPFEVINILPNYFQSQILKIANSINYLSNSIWDKFDTTQVPNDLTEYLLKLNIDGLDRPTFEKNFAIINTKHLERIEQKKNAPLLKKWADILLEIKSLGKKVEDKSMLAKDALLVLTNTFSYSELNSIPAYANEIRSQIGYAIRSLSISMWNKQKDLKNAISAIRFALKIDVSCADKLKFEQDLKDLAEIETKNVGYIVCNFCEIDPPDDSCKIYKTIYRVTSRRYLDRSVQYQYLEIEIPRCESCKNIHSNAKGKLNISLFFGIIIGCIIGAMIDENFIIGGLIGGGAGWLVGEILRGQVNSRYGIKDDSNSTLSNHPILKDKMRLGWTFSKPSA